MRNKRAKHVEQFPSAAAPDVAPMQLNATAGVLSGMEVAKQAEPKEFIRARLVNAFSALKGARYDVRGNWSTIDMALDAIAASITRIDLDT